MLHRQFFNDLHEVEYVLLFAFYQEHRADLPQKQSSIDHLTTQLKLYSNVSKALYYEENEPLRNMADYKQLISQVSMIRNGIMKHRDRLLKLQHDVLAQDDLEAIKQIMDHGILHAGLVINTLQARREHLQT